MKTDWQATACFMFGLLAVIVLSFNGHSSDAATVGLIGILGTFKPRTGGVSDQTAQTMVDKIPPTAQGEMK